MRPDLMLAALLIVATQDPAPTATPAASPAPEAETDRTPGEARALDGRRLVEPRRLKGPSPKWPDRALQAGLTGKAILDAQIDAHGKVLSVQPVRGPRILNEAAAAAVRHWTYSVTKLDGLPVPVLMTITVEFKLDKPPTRQDVLQSVDDSDPEIRGAAIRWLGRYRPVTSEQRSALERAARDPVEMVRKAADEALARLEKR